MMIYDPRLSREEAVTKGGRDKMCFSLCHALSTEVSMKREHDPFGL